MQYHLAIDIGASSGRLILGHVEDGTIKLREIYRFDNTMTEQNGRLCWDIDGLFANILEGLRQCAGQGIYPATLGIDTWGVDYVLLDGNGVRIGDAVAYRDGRTEGIDVEAEKLVSFAELYEITGIQKLSFNTIYQLLAQKKQDPALLERAEHLLMIPDYLSYLLTGRMCQEYTNATTTALVNARTKQWDRTLIEKLGLPQKLFRPLSMPGEEVGKLKPGIAEDIGFDCTVILPATHDTGSAFLAVPAQHESSVYLSSGTWSLLGVELPRPITTDDSRTANFTNEGGYLGRYRFLKNIMGLWMIQSVRRDTGGCYSYAELEEMARQSTYGSIIDVNDDAFLSPDDMSQAIRHHCAKNNMAAPEPVEDVAACIYYSLADCYAQAIAHLSALTGCTYTDLHIIGGGSQDAFLNQLTADKTGLKVHAGPVEGTALGNLIVQMIYSGEFADLASARAAVARSFDILTYTPVR